MLAQDIIGAKRDGHVLSQAQIEHFVRGLVDGAWSDAQVGAFAMAVFLRGMRRDEVVVMTRAMMQSGRVMSWRDMPGPVLDKHSSGGVGDKVSLMLPALLAACGAYVPMISGRGLGHTGGTCDKFDAIPGYCSTPPQERFEAVVRRVGCAVIAQTADLAPADGRLYGLRDVTATVASIPLITASILSKKLAAGLQGLVMDVKCGNGAFAESPEMAQELAQSIVAVANSAGLPTRALITDMNQVLGREVGNALEVMEAIRYLKGETADPRLHQITLALGVELLQMGGLASDEQAARDQLQRALDSGAAAERFASMVSLLGGPHDLLERPELHLTVAPVVLPVPALQSGRLSAMRTREIGMIVVALGGGRAQPGDAIDPRVGLSGMRGLGEILAAGEPLAFVHAADQASAELAAARLQEACTLTPAQSEWRALPLLMTNVK